MKKQVAALQCWSVSKSRLHRVISRRTGLSGHRISTIGDRTDATSDDCASSTPAPYRDCCFVIRSRHTYLFVAIDFSYPYNIFLFENSFFLYKREWVHEINQENNFGNAYLYHYAQKRYKMTRNAEISIRTWWNNLKKSWWCILSELEISWNENPCYMLLLLLRTLSIKKKVVSP